MRYGVNMIPLAKQRLLIIIRVMNQDLYTQKGN